MIVFGAVLLILALVVIAYVWLAMDGEAAISIDYGVLNVELSPLWFFLAGGITLAVATSGLWLMGVGAKSSTRRAKEVRELRRQAKESDRRAERDGDRAALGTDRAAGEHRGGGTSRTGSSSGSHQTRHGSAADSETPKAGSGQQPILPRPGRGENRGPGGVGAGGADPTR